MRLLFVLVAAAWLYLEPVLLFLGCVGCFTWFFAALFRWCAW